MENKKILKRHKTVLNAVKQKTLSFLDNYIRIEGDVNEGKAALDRRLNYAAKGIFNAVLAFFFGRSSFSFSVYPLATAFFCATDKYIPFIYVGSLISSLFVQGMSLPLFMSYTLGFFMRLFIAFSAKEQNKQRIFSQVKQTKVFICLCMTFTVGLMRCLTDGFLWYDFFGMLLGILLTPLITLILCGALEAKHKYTPYRELGTAALMALSVYSLRGYELFGFSLCAIAAFTFSLYVSKECGLLRGTVIGVLCGIGYNMLYAPLFAIAALISGMFWRLGNAYATIAALVTGVFYGIYANGFAAFHTLAPDLLAATLIFIPLAKFELLPRVTVFDSGVVANEGYYDKISISQKKNEGSTQRLHAMSHALTSLSGVFYNLSAVQKRPDITDINAKCESCFEKHCNKCPRHVICWDEYYSDTRDAINKLAIEIYNGNTPSYELIPCVVSKRCNRMEEIINDINEGYSNQLREAMISNKAEVFAIDYAAMSKMLEEAINENTLEYELDKELTARLKSSAKYLNFGASSLAVYGKRRKRIIAGGIDLARVKLGARELHRSFERACKIPLTQPNFSIEDDHISMTMQSARTIRAEYAKAAAKKENEDVNGDSITFFENNEDYFYALLSDGMGSGRDAAVSSGLAKIYLDRMLRAGNKKSQSIQMLNSFLQHKNCESFATVDLLEIDLLSAQASFVKSGAAASYILRGTSIFKIASNTMPVGITKKLNTEEVSFKLQGGDVVVLVSDGIAQSFEEGLWLADILTNEWGSNMTLQDMCEKILDQAKERNESRDDMTVGMVKISKQK